MKLFKKETKKAAKVELLDEHEVDPISWTLFEQILNWAIKEGNIYVWVFSIYQWNCMAQSHNIGNLAYHNFKMGGIQLRFAMIKQSVIKLVIK